MQTKPAPKKTEPHEMPANPPAPFERDIKNCEAVLAVAVMALEQAKDAPYVELYGALAKQRGISPRQMAAVFERYRQDSKLLEMLDTGPSAQLLTTELKDGRVFTFLSYDLRTQAPSARAALAAALQARQENIEKTRARQQQAQSVQEQIEETAARAFQNGYAAGRKRTAELKRKSGKKTA